MSRAIRAPAAARKRVWSRFTAAVLLAASVTAACGSNGGGRGGGGPAGARRQVAATLEQAGFPPATVRCATDRMFARLSGAEIRLLIRQSRQGADQVSASLRKKVADAVAPCVPASSTTTTVFSLPTIGR